MSRRLRTRSLALAEKRFSARCKSLIMRTAIERVEQHGWKVESLSDDWARALIGYGGAMLSRKESKP